MTPPLPRAERRQRCEPGLGRSPELRLFAAGQLAKRRTHRASHRDAPEGEDALERRVEREAVELVAQAGDSCTVFARWGAHEPGDELGERVREAGDGSRRATLETLDDERLGADEDVEALEEVGGEAVERTVGDFRTGEIGSDLAEPLDDGDRDRVPHARLELVQVERRGGAGAGRRSKVGDERVVVEGEVRRRDRGDAVDAERGGVLGEGDRVGGGLRSAVHNEAHVRVARAREELGRAAALVRAEEETLPGRPEREDPVEPAVREKAGERLERVLVEGIAAGAERRDRSGEGSPDHGGTLDFRPDRARRAGNGSEPRRGRACGPPGPTGPSRRASCPVSALRVDRDGPVLRVTLARPERRNAFDPALIEELTHAFADVGDARAVLLAGEGTSFSAGADIEWMRSSIDLSYSDNVEDALRLHRMLSAIDQCPAPVIARVQGYVLGGGCGLVACSDVVVAARDAVFAFSETKLGIIPAVISPFVLRRIGAGPARRYFLTGERIDADAALRIGLVHEVAPDVDAVVKHVVGELMSAAPEATRWAKRLVRERPEAPLTARWSAERRVSEEGQEGLRAFLEKRAPAWSRRSS